MHFILLLLLTAFNLPAWAVSPLIEADWLSQHLEDENLVLLDIRPQPSFDYAHIPHSVNSDYALWRQPKGERLYKMLPSKTQLQSLLENAGINKDSSVVILSLGQTAADLAAASRVYWTLKQINHQQVSILNGGLVAWANKKLPLTRQTETRQKTLYPINAIAPQLDSQAILQKINKSKTQLVDVRSDEEFQGLIAGASDERPGTLKGAKNIPYQWFTINSSGILRSKKDLQAIADSFNLDKNSEQIVFCHTGHRAALSWFVLHELLGYNKAQLYDGSMRDWATQDELPMVQHIPVSIN